MQGSEPTVGTKLTALWVLASMVAAAISGCGDGRPRNPASEVFDNPPDKLAEPFPGLHIELNGVEVGEREVVIPKGDSVTVSADLNLDTTKEATQLPMTMLHVRFKPHGASSSEWKTYPFSDEFVGAIGPDGTMELTANVTAPSGTYDVRCYILSHRVTEPAPDFWLVRKSVVVIP